MTILNDPNLERLLDRLHERSDPVGVCLQRVHAGAKLFVGQPREKRVTAKRRSFDKAGPVGSDGLPDHLMRDAGKPGAFKRFRDIGSARKLGVDQRLQHEEMPMREIALARAVANAEVTASHSARWHSRAAAAGLPRW